ncbi:melanoma-associated antigen B4-like [Apodemus sylvaticus]|uniref:melanoma-associated antigen B4-like n=1 Tax=Apodemus sylvaticus TaxID=10129 RepID=UPI002243EC28|nr:melanoma-associated antigen B4-like [Apodemus sylvaticus]
MPRGQKSKARAREKRRQVQEEAQGLKDGQAKAGEKGESPSCSDRGSGEAVASTSTAGFPQKSKFQGGLPPSIARKRGACRRSRKSIKGPREESSSCSRVPRFNDNPQNDLLTRKTGILMQYLLCKYKMKQPANKGEMLKVINRRFKEQLPEILKKASERIQLVFGLEVKEIKPNGGYYTLVSKVDPSVGGNLTTSLPFPQNGLLMPLLGVIFLNGNRATEAEIWEFLNILGIYDGKAHIIFGDPRKLITKDLVKEKYLVYQKEANTNPPSFEFLWGPRAHAETTKMKVLEFLAKVNETIPQAFPTHYEEALRDQEERARAEAEGSPGTTAKDKAKSKVTLVDSSCKDKAKSKVTLVDSSCKDKAKSKVTLVDSSCNDKAKSKITLLDSDKTKSKITLVDSSCKDKAKSKVILLDSSCKDKAKSKVTLVDSCKDKAKSKVTLVDSSCKDKAKSKVTLVDSSCNDKAKSKITLLDSDKTKSKITLVDSSCKDKAKSKVTLVDSCKDKAKSEITLVDSSCKDKAKSKVTLVDSCKDKAKSEITLVDSSCKDKAKSKVILLDSSCKDKAKSKVTLVDSSCKDKAKSKVTLVDSSCKDKADSKVPADSSCSYKD